MINVALFIIAVLFFSIFIIPGIIYIIFDIIQEFLLVVAIAIDKGGNAVLGRILNDLAKTKEGYLFGNSNETISSALGKNKKDGTLKPLGAWLCYVLDRLDENHCLKSIDYRFTYNQLPENK